MDPTGNIAIPGDALVIGGLSVLAIAGYEAIFHDEDFHEAIKENGSQVAEKAKEIGPNAAKAVGISILEAVIKAKIPRDIKKRPPANKIPVGKQSNSSLITMPDPGSVGGGPNGKKPNNGGLVATILGVFGGSSAIFNIEDEFVTEQNEVVQQIEEERDRNIDFDSEDEEDEKKERRRLRDLFKRKDRENSRDDD